MSVPNGVMLQAFHWYSPGDGGHWNSIAARAADLAAAGITSVWLPPASKGANGTFDVGYGVYDLYDLGEFDQKGTVRTKYGTRAEFLACVEALRAAGVRVYADIVLNHRLGADDYETVRATPFATADRKSPAGEPRDILAPTAFTFPGRAGAHSDFTVVTGGTSTAATTTTTGRTTAAPSTCSTARRGTTRRRWSSAASPS